MAELNIDEFIEKSKTMPNVSEGGSQAYSFGDYILVKYKTMKKYGEARPYEEEISVAVNNKNNLGVNTPKHLAIKRLDENDDNICYVLQEKAPGETLVKYTASKNKPDDQLERQQELIDIPQEHYIKLAKDYGELFHMGLEPQFKNIFYDKDKGFTIIDLLDFDESGINYDNLSDIIYLKNLMECISNVTQIHEYQCKDADIIKKSKEVDKQRFRY